MKKVNKLSIAKKVIKEESLALSKTAAKIDLNFEKVCDIILAAKGKITSS